MHRIAGPERPSTLFSKTERRSLGQKNDFTLYMAEQFLNGTNYHAPLRNARETDPKRAWRIARRLVEQQGLVNGRIPKNQFAIERRNPVEKGSSPVPSAEPGRARKAALTGRYPHLDCYEFVAAVLEENGIRYYGKDGVGNALIEKARAESKPSNHFLTGEGLTQLLSSDTVTLKVKGETVQQTWEALEPKLKEGSILSFSSRRAGHTGIVGVRDGRWVFINSSGNLGEKRSYRLKEEDLVEEIQGWLKKARRDNSPLSITLGQVDRDLAAAYRKPESSSVAEMRKGRVNLLA